MCTLIWSIELASHCIARRQAVGDRLVSIVVTAPIRLLGLATVSGTAATHAEKLAVGALWRLSPICEWTHLVHRREDDRLVALHTHDAECTAGWPLGTSEGREKCR
jgi:hypothetical protein